MKDLGSIYPLYEFDYQKGVNNDSPLIQNRTLLSLGREGFYIIAQKHNKLLKKVLIPAYTCQTVITPFVELGWQCEFYSITKGLKIDTQDLLNRCNSFKPSIVVVHPYYGMDYDADEIQDLQKIHNQGIIIVKDNTQAIFTTQNLSCIDYEVGSFRKWFPIPDGGYIKNFNIDNLLDNEFFNQCQEDAMYLRGQYFKNNDQRTKNISIRLNKLAVSKVENCITAHKISELSKAILTNEDIDNNITRRNDNFRYLHDNIKDSIKVYNKIPNDTFAPLYYPIYVENRSELQKELAQNHIYAPILWGVETESVIINETIKYIYDHILVLPIDQRYYIEDMDRMIRIINK